MRRHPRRPMRMGSRTSSENVVRVCERMSGTIGCRASPLSGSFPVKTARPRAAETPQRNAAEAMNKYPRRGWGALAAALSGLDWEEFRIRSPISMMGPEEVEGQEQWLVVSGQLAFQVF